MQQSQIDEILLQDESNYNARLFRKTFIPVEEIAQDPLKYGYLKLQPRESRARQKEFLRDTKKVCAIVAANRSGKTQSAVVKSLMLCLTQKKPGNFWMLTESFDAQRLGVQEKINEYLKPEDIKQISYVKRGVYSNLTLMNGVFIEFKSYDQGREKLQSAKLIGALFDEEPPEDIYDEVYTRTMDLNGQCLLAFTPLKGMTWSYKRLFSNKSNMISIYNWGMADNPFIPLEEIEEAKRNWSPKKVKMRLYGEYQGSERAIFDTFYRAKHVKPNLLNRDLPVDVSVDWGINVTAICFMQGFKGVKTDVTTGIKKVVEEHYIVDAVELTGYSYPMVMQYIINKKYWIENYYCDPAGRARSQSSKSGASLLDMIKDEFGIRFSYISKLGVEESIDVLSSYFQNDKGDARLFIQEGIKLNAAGDSPEMRFENYIRDDETGQPIKDGINDHFCFIGETKINTINGLKRIDSICVDDYVLTRKGYKKVVAVMRTENQKVSEYDFNGVKITCTDDHPIFLKDGLTIDAVRYDKTYKCQSILYLTIKNIIGTASIIYVQLVRGLESVCTLLFGSFIKARLKKVFKYIIKTIIEKITILKTFKLSIKNHTCLITLKKDIKKIQNSLLMRLIKLDSSHLFGMVLKQVVNGILRTQKTCGKIWNGLSKIVFFVLKNIRLQNLCSIIQNSVQMIVNLKIGECQESMILKQPACIAIKSLRKTNTAKYNAVQEVAGLRIVFNIEVQCEHEYFANGILVSNCDSVRYLLLNRIRGQKHGFIQH